jgi:hypothetical protein
MKNRLFKKNVPRGGEARGIHFEKAASGFRNSQTGLN